jgi:hypothetical protein
VQVIVSAGHYRAPASAHEQNQTKYGVCPHMTTQGIQDFLGDEPFLRARNNLHLVAQLRPERGGDGDGDADGGGDGNGYGAKILGRCYKERAKGQEMCTTSITFDGNRVVAFECSCREERDGDDEHSVSSDASAKRHRMRGEPCRHIGPLLLVLQKKMHEEAHVRCPCLSSHLTPFRSHQVLNCLRSFMPVCMLLHNCSSRVTMLVHSCDTLITML